eukprot:TRINITY_DN2706_c0_g1_i3.p2 TRINITY_DN2706_c0_g1~~TRINITY_DN2706_c0_g1_i3.p2  ORF type:complete len:416 (+),score=90.88 TRINITY_DN2706_c0_g1_i3:386-1633(+)
MSFGTRVDGRCVEAALRHCTALTALSCEGCLALDQAPLMASRTLRQLRVGGPIASLRMELPSLERLDCSDCWQLQTIAWDGAPPPASGVPLERLAASSCAMLRCVAPFLAVCSGNVTELDFTSCDALPPAELCTAVSLCPHAVELGLCCACVHDGVLREACRVASGSLHTLALSIGAAVTAAGAGELRQCLLLQRVALPRSVTAECVADLAAHLKNLRAVELMENPSVDSGSVAALLASCTALDTLTMCDCPRVGDAAFEPLACALTPGAGAVLAHLAIGDSDVTDAALLAVAGRCAALHTIDLSGDVRVTDTGVAAVLHGCPRLAVITLQRCLLLTNAVIAALAAAHKRDCGAVEFLDVYGCAAVGSGALSALLDAVDLRQLNASALVVERLEAARLPAWGGVRFFSTRNDWDP